MARSINRRRLQNQLKTAEDTPRRVPACYGRFNETPLRAEVHLGPQTINFNVP